MRLRRMFVRLSGEREHSARLSRHVTGDYLGARQQCV
jgi:hypothetical protein